MNKRLPPMIDDPSQPPYVRELLQAGRDFRVADYDVAKGLDKHLGNIAAGTPAPPWAQSLASAKGLGATGAASGSLVPWVILPIATATVVAAVMLGTSSEPAPAPRTVVAAPHAAPQTVAPAAPIEPQQAVRAAEQEAASEGAPAQRAQREQPARPATRAAKAARTDRRATAAAKSAPTSTGTQPLPFKPKAAQAAGAAQAHARAQDAQPEAAAVQPEATIAIEDPKPAASAQPVEPPAQPQPAPQDEARLEREMAMLAMSQRVLHTDPARALKLARQGEAEFAGSMFTQERQQLVLLALVELGKMDEAKRLAKPYLARYPNGPFSDRVRRALATGKVAH